jgi:hypothetical protein
MSSLRDIWNETGRTGAAKLRDAARRQGLQVSLKEAQDFVKSQPTAQVFAAPPNSSGKVTSPELNHTWQADLVDYTSKNPSNNSGFRFALVVTDVFSRKTFTEPVRTKTPASVLEAFKSIVKKAGANPKMLSTDSGGEFKGAFEKYLETEGTAHLIKEQINHLAVVDASIKSLKDIMKKDLTETRSENWTKALGKAAAAINSNSHSGILGSAPNDVKGSEDLQFELEKRAGEDMQVNNKLYLDRLERLNRAGAFRIVLPRSTWMRASQPRYGNKVYILDFISGTEAVATDGTRVPLRDALPVNKDSKDTAVPRALRGGRQNKDDEKKGILQRYANILKSFLADGAITLQKAGARLRNQGGFSERMGDLGMNGPGSLKKFIDLFPEFTIDGRAPNAKVRLVQAAPSASAAAPAAAPAAPAAAAPNAALPGGGRIRITRLPRRPSGR